MRIALAFALVVVFFCASSAESASKKKKKKKRAATPKPDVQPEATEQEDLCVECYRMAHHLHMAMRQNIKHASKPTPEGWLNVMRAGCDKSAPDSRCSRVLVGGYGGAMAGELADLYDSADGDLEDSTINDPMRFIEAFCAPDSLTSVCPQGVEIHSKLSGKDTLNASPEGTVVEMAFLNKHETHAIELRLFDASNGKPCSGDAYRIMKSVRIIEVDQEQIVAVEKSEGWMSKKQKPTIRITPMGAECEDGLDVAVDFSGSDYRAFRVTRNARFRWDLPRNATNAALEAHELGSSRLAEL